MLHVIKHVPDTGAILGEVYRIPKLSDRIVIETVCYDTMMLKIMGYRERSVKFEDDDYLFTFDTFRSPCKQGGGAQVDMQAEGRTQGNRFWN